VLRGLLEISSRPFFSSPPRPDRLWGLPGLVGSGGSFLGGKAAVAWSWPLTFI